MGNYCDPTEEETEKSAVEAVLEHSHELRTRGVYYEHLLPTYDPSYAFGHGRRELLIRKTHVLIDALAASRLASLDFYGVKIGSEGCVLMSLALDTNMSLLILDLSHCGIDDEGCKVLSFCFGSNHTLRELYLMCNYHITDTGIGFLAEALSSNNSMMKLNVQTTKKTSNRLLFELDRHLSRNIYNEHWKKSFAGIQLKNINFKFY